MEYVDPTKVRLSEHFLLSDFMGCNSVYSKGYKNLFIDPTGEKLDEAKYLCESVLEPLLLTYGPMSVGYGYISPELSRRIVKYQDPELPSYHRWDKGAAADVVVHSQVRRRAPVMLAHDIDEQFDYSRMITYSESPYICLATQLCEKSTPRKAFYENRYMGVPKGKPLFVKKSATQAGRLKQRDELVLSHDWRGAGYPTYHGGGVKQLHHIRTSRFSMVSDFLFSVEAVAEGIPNMPKLYINQSVFESAGEAYDTLLRTLDVPRLSIIRAYEAPRFNVDDLFSWKEFFAIDFKPPSYLSAEYVGNVATGLMSGRFSTVSVDNVEGIVRVVGVSHG